MRILILFLLALNPLAWGADALARGEVVPKVACGAEPVYSYALYLPKEYSESKSWPVVFGFAPDGDGMEPVNRFRDGAERLGYILVGSNDSRNGPLRPALQAMEALWRDVNARFRVDPKRCYAVGFSGGARMAMRLALAHPKAMAGLISFGAFGTEQGLLTGLKQTRFVLWCGMEDFNHWELVRGREELRSRNWVALADRFEGEHRWPSREVCAEALEFMDLGAMERGWIPADSARRAAFLGRRRRAALEAEEQGQKLLALRRWRDLAELCPDAEGAASARARVAQLALDPQVKAEQAIEEAYEEKRREFAQLRTSPAYGKALFELNERAKSADPLEGLMMRRILASEVLALEMAAFEAAGGKKWDQAARNFSALAALRERDPRYCIYLAGALAQQDRPQEAFSHLREAVRRGYGKPDRVRNLEWLRNLKGDPRFEEILADMAGRTSVDARP